MGDMNYNLIMPLVDSFLDILNDNFSAFRNDSLF
jgi:hypothetical protein